MLILVIPALRRGMEEDCHKFKTILNYLESRLAWAMKLFSVLGKQIVTTNLKQTKQQQKPTMTDI